MFFYLLFVLFAYYILKPVSRAMFLNKFDTDKLPALYILIAGFGGVFAYLYSKLAAKNFPPRGGLRHHVALRRLPGGDLVRSSTSPG